MRKVYPYLDNPYKVNLNDQQDSRNFLEQIDDFINQKQYIRITLLDWQENGIKEIEGELTSGSITKDGSSTIRRTCNFSCTVDGESYNIDNMDMDFAINKKIFIEVGIKNYTNEYPEYPILWFPQGIFYISSFSVSSSATTSVNISIQLKDKMAGLNGDVGGLFPATTILDTMDTQLPTGEYVTEKVLLYDLIIEVVNHIGGELLQNIVVEDVPKRIQRIMRWMGENPLWMAPVYNKTDNDDILYDENNIGYYDCRLSEDEAKAEKAKHDNYGEYKQYNAGDDVGYIYDDFYYTDDFTVSPGSSVTNVLDSIVEYLGNYEYFYDEFGIFHFREIKNYLNTTQATIVSMAASPGLADGSNSHDTNEAYLTDITTGKSIFNFSHDKNLINITVNPQYDNIKNDFIVQGLRKMTVENISFPIRYHLAIDYKPRAGHIYKDLLIYESPSDGLIKCMFPYHVPSGETLPEVGNFNIFYMLTDTYQDADGNTFYGFNDTSIDEDTGDPNGGVVYFWSEDNEYITIRPLDYIPPDVEDSNGYKTYDWRTEIYLRGLLARNNGTDAGTYFTNLQNSKANKDYEGEYPWLEDIFNTSKHEKVDISFYYEELNANWPVMYDLRRIGKDENGNRIGQMFWAQQADTSLMHTSLTDGNFYLDFIDPATSGIGEFCVSNIGRRSQIVSNDKINCLFEPTFPNINFINLDDDTMVKSDTGEQIKRSEALRDECIAKGQPYTQVHGEIYYALSTGGYHFSCFDEIKYQLFLHTNYAKTLSLIALPAFYLEPNSRVTVNDASTNTYGDYMITNVTIPFGAGNTMSVSASECNMDRVQ